jgi:hypothetical protein
MGRKISIVAMALAGLATFIPAASLLAYAFYLMTHRPDHPSGAFVLR